MISKDTFREKRIRAACRPRTSSQPAGYSGTFLAQHNRECLEFTHFPEGTMADRDNSATAVAVRRADSDGSAATSRERLIELLNEDLAREYQAIIAYIVYSQVLKGAQYMTIAGELEKHAKQELDHALIIAKQIDYLGGMPTV